MPIFRGSLSTLFILLIVSCSGSVDPLTNGDTHNKIELAEVPLSLNSTASSRDQHCAILFNGDIKCWGASSSIGLLGQGNNFSAIGISGSQEISELSPLQFGGLKAISVFSAVETFCALFTNSKVKCWGNLPHTGEKIGDEDGELAVAEFIEFGSDKEIRSLSIGDSFLCALFADGFVRCLGSNSRGQLGQPGFSGGESGMESSLVQLPQGLRALRIASTNSNTCAILDDGTIRCWGDGSHGVNGNGSTSIVGDEASEMGEEMESISIAPNSRPIHLYSSAAHYCALFENGKIKCWGDNDDGECGTEGEAFGDAPGEMETLSYLSFSKSEAIVAIGLSNNNSCAAFSDGAIICWGFNELGQLGQGDTLSRGKLPASSVSAISPISFSTSDSIFELSLAYQSPCAHLSDGTIKCWGRGSLLGVGVSDPNHAGDSPGEIQNQPKTMLGGLLRNPSE